MSLTNPENSNISSESNEWKWLGFSKKVSLALWAFILSTNLALAEPNKVIWTVSFETWWTAELYIDKNWKYQIRNGNAKNGSDYVYGKSIINGESYIVFSDSIDRELEVFLERDILIYKEYVQRFWEWKAYKLVKKREEFIRNFMISIPNSTLEEAFKAWNIVLLKIY